MAGLTVAITKVAEYSERSIRRGIADLFHHLGYPEENPLGRIVHPGDSVFIKPNWVTHEYRKSCNRKESVYSTITHESVVRVVADYVAEALQGSGEIRIGDNPSIDADFERLMELTGIRALESRYDVPCEIMDLRPLVCLDLKDYGKFDRMVKKRGDPRGTIRVNLGRRSLFTGINPRAFRGVFTNRTETIRAHTGVKHEYSFANSIVDADVYISLPKLKTHHKCGVTLNLKGLVGTVTDKNLLVHWRLGWPGIGGDEQPSFIHWLRGLTAKTKKRGAWPGNDSIWRMVVDLYTAFCSTGKRRTFSVIDGILAGEGDGPFCPSAKEAQVLLAGENLLAVDCVATRLMGFKISQVQYLHHLVKSRRISLDHITVIANHLDGEGFFEDSEPHLSFQPPSMWPNLSVKSRP
ncbi:MAG: DUF362 domain-containing protein [Pseudomonadota bacterium]